MKNPWISFLTNRKISAFFVLNILTSLILLFISGCCFTNKDAMAEKVTEGTMYAGLWYPAAYTSDNFDDCFKGEDLTHFENEINKQIVGLLDKNIGLKNKLGLFFPNDVSDQNWSRIFTIVLSRATDNVVEYDVKGEHLEQHFFDVTVSLIVMNPNESDVEYSRILTGELPVLADRKLSNTEKMGHFSDVLKRTTENLISATENEFAINYDDNSPVCYFQVANIKIKKDADCLNPYQTDLKQFLHDALIDKAQKLNVNVRFLPPETSWDAEIWRQFKEKFGVSLGEKFGYQNRAQLLKADRLLTVSFIMQKVGKTVAKENKSEAYHSYISYAAGGISKRTEDNVKISYPKNEKDRIATGNASVEYHEVKGYTSTASDTIMFLDASQKALADLSTRLIALCEKSREEVVYE